MILSYQDIFKPKKKRVRIKATVTTKHPASSYGQPVIVLDDGGALDLVSWVVMSYRVEKSTEKERQGLIRLGLI